MGKFSVTNLMSRGNNIVQLTIITAATFLLMCELLPDTFLTLRNLKSMSFLFPELGILSIAMMMAMLIGGIDLSLVGIANLTSILVGFTLIRLVPKGAAPETALRAILLGVAARRLAQRAAVLRQRGARLQQRTCIGQSFGIHGYNLLACNHCISRPMVV